MYLTVDSISFEFPQLPGAIYTFHLSSMDDQLDALELSERLFEVFKEFFPLEHRAIDILELANAGILQEVIDGEYDT